MRLANALANTLARLGSIACETGEAARASELYRESLEPVQRFVFRYEAVACLEGLARVAAMQDQPEQAARLLGASAALREEMGTPLSPIAQVDHDHAVNAAARHWGKMHSRPHGQRAMQCPSRKPSPTLWATTNDEQVAASGLQSAFQPALRVREIPQFAGNL